MIFHMLQIVAIICDLSCLLSLLMCKSFFVSQIYQYFLLLHMDFKSESLLLRPDCKEEFIYAFF